MLASTPGQIPIMLPERLPANKVHLALQLPHPCRNAMTSAAVCLLPCMQYGGCSCKLLVMQRWHAERIIVLGKWVWQAQRLGVWVLSQYRHGCSS